MLSRASLALSLRSPAPEPFPPGGDGAVVALPSLSSVLRLSKRGPRGGALVVMAADSRALSGVVFEPFEELKVWNTMFHMSIMPCMHTSIVITSPLKALPSFSRSLCEEEREQAEKLMKYQNKRGGRVKLHSIVWPLSEFDHPEKGDALYAMELGLSLGKLTNEKLLRLHSLACKSNDPQTADFVESEFLGEQVEAIKKISDYISQLRRVGKGHGVWHFDPMLLHEEEAVA
ncbi:putative ferroxidase [Dioscorea sansibarensis]